MMRIAKCGGAAAAAVVAMLVAGTALAQPGPGPGAGRGPGMGPRDDFMMGPGMMGRGSFGFMCNPRSAGMAEWRMKRIEDTIKPNDAQKAALADLRAASEKAAAIISAACSAGVPEKSSERMALMEKRVEAMLQAIKTVRPAFEAFYAKLDDTQKSKLDATGPRRWGWQGWHWPWRDKDGK